MALVNLQLLTFGPISQSLFPDVCEDVNDPRRRLAVAS